MNDLAIIETILRKRISFFGEIRDSLNLASKLRAMLVSNLLFFALYGIVMGANHSFAQALSSGIKLPILFLVTLFICAPSLYFFNIFYGSDQSIKQSLSLILTSMTVTAILLLSLAPITFFFLLTTSEYQFFKLLNVVIFAISGFMGVQFLAQGMTVVSPDDWIMQKPTPTIQSDEEGSQPKEALENEDNDESPINQTSENEGASKRRWVLRLWMLLYGFVGSQLAWTLRPFVGSPDIPFQLFRELGGNFYSNVLQAIGHILGFS